MSPRAPNARTREYIVSEGSVYLDEKKEVEAKENVGEVQRKCYVRKCEGKRRRSVCGQSISACSIARVRSEQSSAADN